MERCPSGLRCRPGTSVWGITPPRVRIPSSPFFSFFFLNLCFNIYVISFCERVYMKNSDLILNNSYKLEVKVYLGSRKIMLLRAKCDNLSGFYKAEINWLSKFKSDEIGLLLDFENEKFFYYFNKICISFLQTLNSIDVFL